MAPISAAVDWHDRLGRRSIAARPAPPDADELRDRQLVSQINALRRVDNVTNWWYLAAEYAYLACVLVAGLWIWHACLEGRLSVIAAIAAIATVLVLVGIGQHRLVMLGHEASHFALFRSQWLNELAGDWCCFFPIWITTYNYRLQHSAHHQYTNDHDRDPDMAYMLPCGQKFRHPMEKFRFWSDCVVRPAVWVPNQLRFLLIRIQLSLLLGVMAPYRHAGGLPGRLILAATVVAQLGLLGLSLLLHRPEILYPGSAALLLVAGIAAWLAPASRLVEGKFKPCLSPRLSLIGRLTYICTLTSTLMWLQLTTGRPWIAFYLVLWVLPLATVFSFLMVLREDMQHSHAPEGKFRNTRDTDLPLLVRWAVFPYGMDLHLAHHLYSMVPHYRLARLNELLQVSPEYRDQRVVIGRDSFAPSASHLSPSPSGRGPACDELSRDG